MQRKHKCSSAAVPLVVVVVAAATGGIVSAQVLTDPVLPEHLQPAPLLSQVEKSVPDAAALQQYIRNKGAALRLGKALFWDMQVGSDGFTSCGSCHFHAGVDNRSKNQVSPGVIATPKDTVFSAELGGGPNYQLTLDDFPLHELEDPNDRASGVKSSSNDVISSQGVHYGIFVSADSGQSEVVDPAPDPDNFQVGGINVRRVEPRNTPTVINAVFNKILFWDGRAKDVFNGVDPSGVANTRIFKVTGPGQLTPVSVRLEKSPLASLSVGPPLSVFEMSASGRPFIEIGDKLLQSMKKRHRILARKGKALRGMRPLGRQLIHPQDSVLAAESRWPMRGALTPTYDAWIRQAFRPEWWNSNRKIQIDAAGNPTVLAGLPTAPNEYTLMEWNFTLFFGLALQEYMATLVDGDTPFDRFQKGDVNALTEQQKRGLRLFVNSASADAPSAEVPGAGCNVCHALPETTRSLRVVLAEDPPDPQANVAFRNIGVRPRAEDPGRLDGEDPSGGRFKIPTLRNIDLTAPYMHNGGMATLEQVIDFYSRGRSDFDDTQGGATPGTILNLSVDQKADLIAFLRALTDDRVRTKKAPFDHPSLSIPNGHPLNQHQVRSNAKGNAVDSVIQIPAVGRNGGPSIAPKNFLGVR